MEALRTYVLARPPEALREELGTGATDVARIVSEVRERLEVDLRPGGDPEEDRWRLLQAVTSFLQNAASAQPLVLVLEDLHWADRGTLDLLTHLARSLAGARLLVVGTYRDVEVDRAHPLAATLAELRRGSNFSRVLLRGLTADEVQRMLSSIAGHDVAWSVAEAIHRQTEGNPLFIQEVVRYLVEEGLLDRETGRQGGQHLTSLTMSIPEGLRDVTGRRLARLSPECNRLLSAAAVIGRDFALETLQALANQPEDQVLAGLEEAVRVGVVEERSRPGTVQYRFCQWFCLALLGRNQEAGEIFEDLMARVVHGPNGDETDVTVLTLLLEAGVVVGDRRAVDELAARLKGLEGLAAIRAVNVTSIGRHLGAAAALLGDPEQARRCYEQALEVCTKIRFRPEIALTRLQMAELCVDEAEGARRAPLPERDVQDVGAHGMHPTRAALLREAQDHLDFCIPELREMKMLPSLERAEALRARLINGEEADIRAP